MLPASVYMVDVSYSHSLQDLKWKFSALGVPHQLQGEVLSWFQSSLGDMPVPLKVDPGLHTYDFSRNRKEEEEL